MEGQFGFNVLPNHWNGKLDDEVNSQGTFESLGTGFNLWELRVLFNYKPRAFNSKAFWVECIAQPIR